LSSPDQPPDELQEWFERYLIERRNNLEAAVRLYKDHLLLVAVDAARSKAPAHNAYRRVIAPLGFSPESLAVATIALGATECVAIATSESCVKSLAPLRILLEGAATVTCVVIDRSDAMAIYREVGNYADEVSSTAVAIVGGNNVMIAGSAAAADLIGFDIWHLDGGRTTTSGDIPSPWTQHLLRVDPPIRALSQLPRAQACGAFDDERFVDAASRYEALAQRTESAHDQFMSKLARAYHAFVCLEAPLAVTGFEEAIGAAESSAPHVRDRLEAQRELMVRLVAHEDALVIPRLENFIGWLIARARCLTERGETLHAVLLGYRALEAVAQRQLLEYGIAVDAWWGDEAVRHFLREHRVPSAPWNAVRDDYLSLEHRWRLLDSLKDPLARLHTSVEEISDLKTVRSDSAFAHGMMIPTMEQALRLVKTLDWLSEHLGRAVRDSTKAAVLLTSRDCRL